MAQLLTSYIEFVDSDYRLPNSISSSDFYYTIKPPYPCNRVVVLSASIPKSYFLVQANYNTVIFVENGIDRTITMPIGNYSNNGPLNVIPGSNTYRGFYAVLLSLLNTGSTVYTYDIDPNTNFVTISATGGTFSSINFPMSSALYRQFGFTYYTNNPATSNSITSRNIPIFQPTDTIYIKSNLVINQGSSLGGNILESIQASNQPYMYSINYQCTVDLALSARPYNPTVTVVSFTLTDSDGFVINLNGLPANIKLMFFLADDSLRVLRDKAVMDNLVELGRSIDGQADELPEPKKTPKEIEAEQVKQQQDMLFSELSAQLQLSAIRNGKRQ